MEYIEYRKKYKREYKSIVKKLWDDIEDNEIEELILGHFEKNNKIFLVFFNKELIGFLNSSIRHDYVEGSSKSPVGYIEGIFVEERFRGQRIGSRLIDKLIDYYNSIGIHELGSDTEFDNVLSEKFHKSLGFQETIIRTFIKKI